MLNGIDPVKMRDAFVNIRKKLKDIDSDDFIEEFKCKVSYYEPPKDDYPERIDIPISDTTLYMDDDYYKDYKLIELNSAPGHLVELLKLSDTNTFYHNLRKAVNSIDRIKTPKVEWVVDFLKREYDAGRKTIVFSNWKRAGQVMFHLKLEELLKENLIKTKLKFYLSQELEEKVLI